MTRAQFCPVDHDHDHFLLTTVVGSYPQPQWLDDLRAAHDNGDMPLEDLREAMDDAVRAAILDQQHAGLDVVTDGEMRREGMVEFFTQFIDGHEMGEQDDGWNAGMPLITDQISSEIPWLVKDFEFASSVADAPLKVTITGPFTLATFSRMEAYDDVPTLVYDFADLVAAEAERLVEAGAKYIQLDEPGLGMSPHGDIAHECLTRVREVIPDDVRFGVHICSGNYEHLKDDMFGFPVDEIDLEFGSDKADDPADVFDVVDDLDVDVGFGVVNTSSKDVESVEDIKDNIRVALEYVPHDRLTITPDCGMKPLPRGVAERKLHNMTTAVEEIEAELDG